MGTSTRYRVKARWFAVARRAPGAVLLTMLLAIGCAPVDPAREPSGSVEVSDGGAVDPEAPGPVRRSLDAGLARGADVQVPAVMEPDAGTADASALAAADAALAPRESDARVAGDAPVAASTPAASCPKGTPCRVMPLGDSITYGQGDDARGGYRGPLGDKLRAANRQVDFVGSQQGGNIPDRDHEGHPGWRIDQIAGRADAIVKAARPHVILLMLGTNDVLQNYALARAPGRLTALASRLLADAPTATLLVASLTPLGGGLDEKVKSYDAAIGVSLQALAASSKRVVFVNMHDRLTQADLLEGIHPNAGGYRKMADVWFTALERLLP